MKPLKKQPTFKNPAVEAVAKMGSIKKTPKPKKKGK